MRVIIDCNVFVMCLTSRSPYHIIFQSLVGNKFELVISTDILLEYQEIISIKYGRATADSFIALLRVLPNVHHQIPHYKWKLIDADPDDNKYCDCAIASRADYIVTEDRHFRVLKTIPWPEIKTLSINSFAAKW